MKFKVEIDVEVEDHDADVMKMVPVAIMDRFAGTAVKIPRIIVTEDKT